MQQMSRKAVSAWKAGCVRVECHGEGAGGFGLLFPGMEEGQWEKEPSITHHA